MNGTKDYYNKTAAEWAENGYSDDSEAPCFRDFLSMLKPGARVLDLGCGCGYDCKRLRESGFIPVGIDFSEESLKIAREQNPETCFLCADMLSDYSQIGKIDGVIAIASLVHIENKDLKTVFEQINKVLIPGGLMLFAIRYGHGKIPEQSFRRIDGEDFDRNFIGHTLDDITEASKDYFEYTCKMKTDAPIWEYHVLTKKEQ